MGIIVEDALDADLYRSCEIEVAAYAGNAASPTLFPGPFPPDSTEQRVQRLARERKEDSTTHYVKAVDEETHEIIAFASWHMYETPEITTVAAESRTLTIAPGANKDACEAFFGELARRRDRIMAGQAFLYLHMLHSDPKHRGRGAGSALMQWGLQHADKINLPVYLESSPDAHKFYEKHGFTDVEVFSFDLSRFGGSEQTHDTALMTRQPKEDVHS